MNKKLQMLKAMKRVIELDENNKYYITVVNRETQWEGEAYFTTNGENKIRVFEGDPDGKDDHLETYEDFIKKYQFDLLWF